MGYGIQDAIANFKPLIYNKEAMPSHEELKNLCFDDGGGIKSKAECRAAMINFMIIDELMDIDEAEDLAEKTLQDLNLWPDTESTTQEKPLE